MKMSIFIVLCFLIVIFSQSHKTALTESPGYNMGAVLSDPSTPAFDYLKTTMDAFHNTFDVYTDLGAAGNHFSTLGIISGGITMVEMDQCCIENCKADMSNYNSQYFRPLYLCVAICNYANICQCPFFQPLPYIRMMGRF